MTSLFRKLIWSIRARQKERELREELQFHLEEEAERRRSEGMSHAQAARAARIDVGNVTLLKEDIRELWHWTFVERLARDVKYGLRTLRRQPIFSASAVAVLILGVGATTAVFSILRGVLIQPLPYRQPGRLMLLRSQLSGGNSTPLLTSQEFRSLEAHTEIFESIAAAVAAEGSLTAADGAVSTTNAIAVSENFFDTLGVAPLLGRSVENDDAGQSVDISHDAWQRYFSSDAAIVGRQIQINGRSMNVVGVLPPDFRVYLGADVTISPQVDVIYLRGHGYDADPFRGNIVIARVRRGLDLAAARAAIDAAALALVGDHPSSYPTGPVRLALAPIGDEVVSRARPSILAAAGAVALVLLIACTNLANLLLARASGRTREIGIRVAIGARGRDITQQLLTEGLLLGAIGAVGGLLVAHWSVATLLALAPAALPRREAIVVDSQLAISAMMVALACAAIVSLAPAWQATRSPLHHSLTKNPARAGWTRGTLVAAQLSLSVILLIGAGLLMRAFVSLRSVPLGFDSYQSVTAQISLNDRRFSSGTIDEARARRQAFYDELIGQLNQKPGVRASGVGFPIPLSGTTMSQRVSLAETQPARDLDAFVALSGYPEALGVALIAGRYFTRLDNDRPMVMIDERAARELWPSTQAVGQRLLIVKSVGQPLWAEVIGVVSHVQNRSPRDQGPPQLWMTYGVRSPAQLSVVVRTGDHVNAAEYITDSVQRLGAGGPARNVRQLDDYVSNASADTRFALFVLGVLAVLALALAGIGIHGIAAYAVAKRRSEIALRLALGATQLRLVWLVVSDTAKWSLVGVLVGIVGSAALTRYLESLAVSSWAI